VIRAVIDPGVLVSAFIGRPGSVADQIIRAWRTGQVEIVVSPTLVSELADVLARPKFAEAAGGGRALDYAEALRIGATMVEDPAPEGSLTRDPTDDYLVRLTWSSGAEVLVSGDHDLLELDRADLTFLSPRALVDQLHPHE
jgi:putative PIN family toxin of toxin-antitoxin system